MLCGVAEIKHNDMKHNAYQYTTTPAIERHNNISYNHTYDITPHQTINETQHNTTEYTKS